MPIFAWNDGLKIFIRQIDEEHKLIIELINRLHDAIEQGHETAELGVVLAELVDYTVKHFEREELFMDMYKYPAAAAHKHEHELLRSRVLVLQDEFCEGLPIAAKEVVRFLREWLIEHIQNIDRQMGAYLDAKGMR